MLSLWYDVYKCLYVQKINLYYKFDYLAQKLESSRDKKLTFQITFLKFW